MFLMSYFVHIFYLITINPFLWEENEMGNLLLNLRYLRSILIIVAGAGVLVGGFMPVGSSLYYS